MATRDKSRLSAAGKRRNPPVRKPAVSFLSASTKKALRADGGAGKKKTTLKQSERALHMLCQQWLQKSGWWDDLLIFHVPNERRGGIGTVVHFKRLGVRPGVADYLLFGCGRDAAIELKDAGGVPSDNQVKFRVKWEQTGKLYFVVRTLEEFQGVVQGLTLFC